MNESVVIVGAGQAAAQAIISLRQEGHAGAITMVGYENSLPYQRPPLSKAFLAGGVTRDRLLIRPADFYVREHVDTIMGATATMIDRTNKRVRLADGHEIEYEALLLTTGGRPRRLDCVGAEHPRVRYLRDIADAEAIRDELREDTRLVIIGAGYVGLEVAATAVKKGASVTVLELAPQVLARVAGAEIAAFFENLHRNLGVHIFKNCSVAGIEHHATGVRVSTSLGPIDADLVLVGIGQSPNIEIAAAAGIACDNGILVDEECRTSDRNIFAAGDCTSHPNLFYAGNLRLESVHNSVEQAKSAAATMCGRSSPYRQVPWFWSEQYDLKLQTAGINRGHDQTIVRGDPETKCFAVFYLKQGRLLAVDAVNRPAEFIIGKSLIQERASISSEQLADDNFSIKSLAKIQRSSL